MTGADNSLSREVKAAARAKRRRAADARFRMYGFVAVAVSLAFLVVLFTSVAGQGFGGFVQSSIRLDVLLDAAVIDPNNTREAVLHPAPQRSAEDRAKDRAAFEAEVWNADYMKLANAALIKIIHVDPANKALARKASGLLSSGADVPLRDMVVADPRLIGTTQSVWVLAHGNVDAVLKGSIDRATPEASRLIKDVQIAWVDQLVADGHLVKRFNWGLFTFSASSEAETAGLGVAFIGSAFMMATVLLLAVPLGVAAAIYLEEFAPRNRWTDLIEVNINNLAAVPSIVFGLLGLAIFINFLGLPRSASLVGGLVLTLMTLPTIIISTRAAIASVPPSIREAALGVGASKMQTVMHHVLPLAIPGILTGTIIGVARALGETAPLLMIGLNAFVVSYPHTPLDSATGLPAQIFEWARSDARGFAERTATATLVLLAFILVTNAFAIFLRQRFERKW